MKMELSVRNLAATIANVRSADRTLAREVRREVGETAEFTRELTQFFAPVDTGHMRDSVRAIVSPGGLVFEVGWDADDFLGQGLAFYPWFQEFGTRYMDAQPSLLPAYAEARPRFESNIRAAIARSVARSRRGR